jgi:lipoate-protein ligase A
LPSGALPSPSAARTPQPSTRLLELGPVEPLLALAIEEAVLESVEAGRTGPAWITWTPARHCIVLGTARPMTGDVIEDAARSDRVPLLRRRSGGGTVVLGPETPVVTLIDTGGHGIRETYGEFCGALTAALAELNLTAELHRPADLAIGGRKIAGLAQRRKKRATLVTASVLARPMAAAAARYLAEPTGGDAPAYRAGRGHALFMTSLEELGTARPEEDFTARLRRHLLSAGIRPAEPEAAELAEAGKLAAELAAQKWVERF